MMTLNFYGMLLNIYFYKINNHLESVGNNTTFVDPYYPRVVIVSRYLIYMAALESNNSAACLISLAD